VVFFEESKRSTTRRDTFSFSESDFWERRDALATLIRFTFYSLVFSPKKKQTTFKKSTRRHHICTSTTNDDGKRIVVVVIVGGLFSNNRGRAGAKEVVVVVFSIRALLYAEEEL
jgi:hypothetical protein